MKLAQAIVLAREAQSNAGEPFRVFAACGFTPQHVATFLPAHLFARLKHRRVSIETGLYGDLLGSLAAPDAGDRFHAVAVFMEWSDLDLRLGFRTTHGWRPDCEKDFPNTSTAKLSQIRNLIGHISERMPVCVALPTLPLPPAFMMPTIRGNAVAFTLQEQVMVFAAALAAMPGVCMVNPQKIDAISPLDRRLDIGSDLRAGFPYSLEHASVLCQLLSELMVPAPRKKGIITDLDNTLWRGILGEDGIDGLSWELARGTHLHALYQEMLASVAGLGTLVAVASQNDPDLVEQALQRKDLVVPRDVLFPVQAGWGPKSESVKRILTTWNVAADSVVFVDDSPLELAEVSAALPDVHCIQFPTRDDRAVYGLLQDIRDLFGKSTVTQEDRLRLDSIRVSSQWLDAAAATAPEDFLKSVDARISLAFDRPDERAFELINKTNQFNLNGRRLDEAAWRAILPAPDRFFLSVSYQEKFGPLGNIAVVSGLRDGKELAIDIWVMSCRDFSRRIEFQTLKSLFERFGADSLRLDVAATDRNGPFRAFVEAIVPANAAGPVRITTSDFLASCPTLYAKAVTE